jgi:hypothetical protein
MMSKHDNIEANLKGIWCGDVWTDSITLGY